MSIKPQKRIRSWWVTASDLSPDPERKVRWEYFFRNPRRDNHWGGPKWIKASLSIVHIKEMRKGNIVVAYQASEGIIGLAYLQTDGFPDPKSRRFDSFDLEFSPTVWLDNLVPLEAIRHLRNVKEDIEFVRVLRGTVFSITEIGFKEILDLILKFNPKQSGEITRFLSIKHPQGEAEVVAIDDMGELKPPHKSRANYQRVIRDSVAGRRLKQFYEYECQVCSETIELPNGQRYAEVHHLRPVGKPHFGKDGKPNTIVVCPYHHVMFDLGAIGIEPKSLTVRLWNSEGGKRQSKLILRHHLDDASLNYQYQKLFKGK